MPEISQELKRALDAWGKSHDGRLQGLPDYQNGLITGEVYLELINTEYRAKTALARSWKSESARDEVSAPVSSHPKEDLV